MTLNKIALSIFIATLFAGCKPKFDTPDPDRGNLDASNYVAVGSSMTAGFSNGALYYEGQKNSYANILAEQLKLIGGGEFKIPFVSQGSVGMGNTHNAYSILGNRTDCQGTVSLGPVKVATQGDYSVFLSNVYNSQGAFNNMGVPNVKVIDMDVTSYTDSFYVRMASGPSSSILSDAVAKNPTFFSVMLGLNDILNYALKGAASDNISPVSGSVNNGFEASINNVIDKLMANGSKGVIANIPSIKSMPYFSTVAWNALKLDATSATNLSNFYANLDSTKFYEGENGFIIMDSNNPFLGFRQAVAGEYILLNVPLDSIKCHKWGSLIPIPDRYSLTLSEIDAIENAINNYNIILKNLATNKGLAFVDVNAFFAKIKSGFIYNGVSVNAAFVSGGAYSLDGLNLTPRGNALLANEFIKAINNTYNSTIPEVNAMTYPAVTFP
ncbi:MAG: SGNH/GDSL hydrolase family protein [Bacteroidota bacterium]